MTRFSRCAWSIVLTLAAGPSAAFAKSFACYPVQRGDTASRLAKRITGDASNKYQPWFEIVDRSARTVPKSQYDHVRSGWRACIFETNRERRPREVNQVATSEAATPVEPAASPPAAIAPPPIAAGAFPAIPDLLRPALFAFRASLNVDPAHLWVGAAVVVPALGFLILAAHVRRRDAARIFMWQFAYLFVREFERPLVDYAAGPAMKVQLRMSPYRARLEICLAPGSGRRYPNLSDHRKNVEYDVARVLSALGDESFMCGRLRTRNEWVVVPFRFNVGLKQRGVRCISSL
jgi:hypothetical protein